MGTKFYHITNSCSSDYEHIRKDGMWYLSWQGGYEDIIRKGYPRPKNKNTILAELYTVDTEDFLHSGGTDVPFIVSEKTYKIFKKNCITGFKTVPVEIVKIATKETNKRKNLNEPEDQILNKTNKINSFDNLPRLYGIKITGTNSVIPDFKTGKTPKGYISPFKIDHKNKIIPDLWIPYFNKKQLGCYVFCSENLKKIIESNNLTNIKFIPFNQFMNDFKKRVL